MNLQTMSDKEKAHILKKVEELVQSDGWSILKQIMETETEQFFRKMALPETDLSGDKLHYTRGIIEGAYRLKTLPDTVILRLKNDLDMAAKTKSAKADIT
jgi:hypothetical protein